MIKGNQYSDQTRGMVKNHDVKPDNGGTKGHSKPGSGGTQAGPPPPPQPKK